MLDILSERDFLSVSLNVLNVQEHDRNSLLSSHLAGRGRGGRGGYKDDRRDRYSGGGRSNNFGGSSYRDRESDRGFGSGPKGAFGGKAQNGGSYGGNSGNSSGSYGNNFNNSNGQGNFGGPANQVGAFGNQSFQGPPQFGGMQRGAQNGMNHPFPFTSQPPPPQAQQPPPPPPMVPYPMPPPFPQ